MIRDTRPEPKCVLDRRPLCCGRVVFRTSAASEEAVMDDPSRGKPAGSRSPRCPIRLSGLDRPGRAGRSVGSGRAAVLASSALAVAILVIGLIVWLADRGDDVRPCGIRPRSSTSPTSSSTTSTVAPTTTTTSKPPPRPTTTTADHDRTAHDRRLPPRRRAVRRRAGWPIGRHVGTVALEYFPGLPSRSDAPPRPSATPRL